MQLHKIELEILVEKYRDELKLEILKSENIGGLEQVPVKILIPKILPDTSIADLIDPDRTISTGSVGAGRSSEGAR